MPVADVRELLPADQLLQQRRVVSVRRRQVPPAAEVQLDLPLRELHARALGRGGQAPRVPVHVARNRRRDEPAAAQKAEALRRADVSAVDDRLRTATGQRRQGRVEPPHVPVRVRDEADLHVRPPSTAAASSRSAGVVILTFPGQPGTSRTGRPSASTSAASSVAAAPAAYA